MSGERWKVLDAVTPSMALHDRIKPPTRTLVDFGVGNVVAGADIHVTVADVVRSALDEF